MTSQRTLSLTLLTLCALAQVAMAQDSSGERPASDTSSQPTRRPPPPRIIAALDANADGVIDAEEIANAATAPAASMAARVRARQRVR